MAKIRFFVFIFICLLFAQCAQSEEDDSHIQINTIPESNTHLPTDVDTLRVLAIGNSYADDGTRYLGRIMQSICIDDKRYCVYVASRPAYSLQQWWNVCENNEMVCLRRDAGSIEMNNATSLCELFAQPWDIIVFQQFSQLSDKFWSFNPYLMNLASHAIADCPNKNVCIAWQMTWNYWLGYPSYPVTADRYHKIVETAQQMSLTNGTTVIIPTGTAIENARHHELLQTEHDLTRDGMHLSYGPDCAIAACTWFQTLIKPAFGVDVSQTKFLWEIKPWEIQDSTYKDECIDVTDDIYEACKKCAIAAVENPFEITYFQ